MDWLKEEVDRNQILSLSEHYSLDFLTATILIRRGLTEPQELLFLMEDDLRFSHNPFLFTEMEEAVERVLAAREEEEKVLVFGDRDVDGVTSTFIVFEELKKLGLDVSWHVPVGEEPYSLNAESLKEYAAKDVTLVITVDCGITSFDEVELAHELGMDVVILDHHNPREGNIPDACAVVNPKTEDSGYPFAYLAGCGVAMKFTWALAFSGTNIYNQSFCLIYLFKDEGVYTFEAVKIRNLKQTSRLILEFKNPEEGKGKIYDFIYDQRIFLYSLRDQENILKEIFSSSVDFHAYPLDREIWGEFPHLKGLSLPEIRSKSRMNRYGMNQHIIDAFFQLFISFLLKRNHDIFRIYTEYLPYVAIGTVADLMPIQNENRLLIKTGVRLLRKTLNPSLLLLMDALKIKRDEVKAQSVTWRIAPLINSAGRMGRADKAMAFLSAETDSEREQLLKELLKFNTERKGKGDELWPRLYAEAEASFDQTKKRGVIVSGNDIPKGITGILASKLVNAFHVPAFVISKENRELYAGSVRSPKENPIGSFLRDFADYFIDYGGHDCAAGFSLETRDFKELVKALSAGLKKREIPEAAIERVDAEIPKEYLSLKIFDTVKLFEPFGTENPPLLFMTRDLTVFSVKSFGKTGDHLKLTLDTGSQKWPAILWADKEVKKRHFKEGDIVDILYQMTESTFNGDTSYQLTIKDIVIHET